MQKYQIFFPRVLPAMLIGLSLYVTESYASTKTQCVAPGEWKNSALKTIAPEKVIKNLARQQVVLLGEDHENAEHHRWQLQTIAKLHALQPDLALGFEAFPRDTQSILDQWVAGKLTEKQLLEQTDWQGNWSYDANFYLPMFHFARMHRIPMIALNVNRSLVSRVSKRGWDNIPAAEREGISEPATASQEYIDSLVDVFAQHMPGNAASPHGATEADSAAHALPDTAGIAESPMFKHFLQGQLLWDRAMAEAIQSRNKTPLIIGIVGAGHIMGGYGIPHQLKSLGTSKISTAMPWDDELDCEQLQSNIVDLAFGVDSVSNEKTDNRPKLGIYLQPAEKGVGVKKIIPGSVAEKLGMQTDDTIVEIAGRPATAVGDIISAVQSTGWGTWLPLVILRKNKRMELVAKFPPRADN